MQHRLMWIQKVFSLSIFTILALSLLSINDAGALQNQTIPGADKNTPANNLLQFRAGNHILGFAPTKAYLASVDHALTIEFLGTKGVVPRAEGDASASGSTTKAQSLKKVVYQNLWDGISLTYEATKDGITESTYQIAPGADVSKIRLKYNVPVEKQSNGSLKFRFEKGTLTESAPTAWQEIDGKHVPVTVSFKVSGEEIGFSVGKYDSAKPLIIDPVYSWNTFYGSGSTDYGYGIAVDGAGNVYVTGASYATWSGPSEQPPLNPFVSAAFGPDIFVLALNSSGAYQWHTFFGSGNSVVGAGRGDFGNAIAVDGSGNVYVTGYSYGTWGTPLNPFDSSGSGNPDIFVLKLNSSGAYQWNTFYGSGKGDGDYGFGIAVDGSGNVDVAGYSYGTWGTPLNPFDSSGSGKPDIFVLQLNSSGAYQWNTFYGSGKGDGDWGYAIAVDSAGNVDVTGASYGTWGTTPLNPYSGSIDGAIFVLQLNSSGAYQWNTFYGSGSGDYGYGIAADSTGNVDVTGISNGTWGTTPLNPYSGNGAIFVLQLNSSGAYQWNTFYGSGSGDYGYGIAADSGGNVNVTGFSNATWSGPSGQSPLNPFDSSGLGGPNVFILKLNSSGVYQWNTFYGSGSGDYGYGIGGIIVDGGGNVDVAGYSYATWGGPSGQLPLNPFDSSGSGNPDIFVLQLQLVTCPATAVQIQGGAVSSTSIQAVYSDASSGDTIMIQALTISENLQLTLPIAVTLQGGYECDFPAAPSGQSTVNGSLTIGGGSGTVTVENLIVQ